MRFLSKMSVVGLLVVFIFICTTDTYGGNPIRKLGRGITNVAFGALEIPMKVNDMNKDEGGLAAVTYGTFLGIAYFLAREAVGIVDVATFPVPLPGCTDDPNDVGWGYGPLMEPEWVVDREHNLFNIIYQDGPMVQ